MYLLRSVVVAPLIESSPSRISRRSLMEISSSSKSLRTRASFTKVKRASVLLSSAGKDWPNWFIMNSTTSVVRRLPAFFLIVSLRLRTIKPAGPQVVRPALRQISVAPLPVRTIALSVRLAGLAALSPVTLSRESLSTVSFTRI